MTQTEAILEHLRSGRTITPIEALNLYGCFRLGARIYDAKDLLADDEEIVAERVTTSGGAVVARYRIKRTTPLTLWGRA